MTDNSKSYYKYCIVPLCTNTTSNTTEKLFFSVPKDPVIRKSWTKAIKRDEKRNPKLSNTSSLWCCEDHFSLKDDMENYCQWMLTKNVKRFKLKPGTIPHRFDCQKKHLPSPIERKGAMKRKRLSLIKEMQTSPGSLPSTSKLQGESVEINLDKDDKFDESLQVDIKKTFKSKETMAAPRIISVTSSAIKGLVDSGVSLRPQDRGPAAKKASRRREPRRHTVSNGIDYNMIKRLKLLEQEKDFLLQGLDVVERARNWYLQQVANVNDKLDRVSKWDIPHSEYSMDAQHERLNFQMTRISEVNQHLNALMETSEKGFPIHMNLAVHQRNIYDTNKTASQTIQRLKNQNHALTEEIAKKSEMITQLETEKSALIRELFHARAFPKKEPNDTTLW